jgi:hypothetical protein
MELLVVVAIIGLLVGLVVVSMHAVRGSATRTESLGALRQMALGYGQYTDEHRGRLLPGYIDTSLFAPGEEFENLMVKLPTGDVLAPEDSQSYVWRLAPYLDNAWETFFADLDSATLSIVNASYGCCFYGPASGPCPNCTEVPPITVALSERPGYGLNSIFVGGDSFHGGAGVTNRNPWQDTQPKIAATRLSEVKNPSRLLLFGPAAMAGSGDTYEDPELGFCELRPPYLVLNPTSEVWEEPQWKVGVGGLVQQTTGGQYSDGAGLPIARSGKDLMPIAHLDGSTVVIEISKLSRDMRFWSPFEVQQTATAPP